MPHLDGGFTPQGGCVAWTRDSCAFKLGVSFLFYFILLDIIEIHYSQQNEMDKGKFDSMRSKKTLKRRKQVILKKGVTVDLLNLTKFGTQGHFFSFYLVFKKN